MYNWQLPDWPNFSYDLSGAEPFLFEFAELSGRVSGLIQSLPERIKSDTVIDIMVVEAMKSSEIEGVYLSRKDVVSSVRRRMGLASEHLHVKDKKADGYAAIMVDVRNTFREKLTVDMLFQWHRMLLPDSRKIITGAWRSHTEPMQVVSGAIGKEKIHFEAPSSDVVPKEMASFIQWFNNTAPDGKLPIRKPVLRPAIAHLYFETIHPFEDGNGRMGRILAEKALAQELGHPVMLSISQAIEARKSDYYKELEMAQKGNEITPWINYFIKTVLEAQAHFGNQLKFVIRVTKFFDRLKTDLNERQDKVLHRMFEEGPNGFEGG
ncbi:MAG: DUF4172 domain-containing protein, partial [Saprospiraceae bacterium]